MGDVIGFPRDELSTTVKRDGKSVQIDVYRADKDGWLLEMNDQFGNSTCWNDPFESSSAAMTEGVEAIESEGIDKFIDSSSKTKNG